MPCPTCIDGICTQLCTLGVVMTQRARWTTADEQTLKALAEEFSAPEIGGIMGRTAHSIRRRCSILGVQLGNQQPWTDDEIARLEMYLEVGVSYGVISKRMGRTESAIAGKVKRLREDIPAFKSSGGGDSSAAKLMALRMPFSQIAKALEAV